jgi:hypothetical protein
LRDDLEDLGRRVNVRRVERVGQHDGVSVSRGEGPSVGERKG